MLTLEICNIINAIDFYGILFKGENMLRSIDIKALVYTCLFCTYFILCYFIILALRLEQLFKQGSTWQIRVAQVILAVILAYVLALATMSLVNSTQF